VEDRGELWKFVNKRGDKGFRAGGIGKFRLKGRLSPFLEKREIKGPVYEGAHPTNLGE